MPDVKGGNVMAFINGMKLRWYNLIWLMGYLWHTITIVWNDGRVAAGHIKKRDLVNVRVINK